MTTPALAAMILAIIAGLVAGAIWLDRRQGRALARMRAKADAQAAIINALTIREEIEDAVNADPDLVGRAVRWVRPKTQ